MTVALPLSRSLAAQLLARSARTLTRPSAKPWIRVECNCSLNDDQSSYHSRDANVSLLFRQARTYATAAKKPASRPKQHTGRTPAKRTTSTTKKAAPAAKKSPSKPKKKVPKKVVRKKATPKAKKAPSKTALLAKARKEQADLKAAALLTEPKNLPASSFQLILVEETKKGGGDVKVRATAASNKYKNLSLEEREVRKPCRSLS